MIPRRAAVFHLALPSWQAREYSIPDFMVPATESAWEAQRIRSTVGADACPPGVSPIYLAGYVILSDHSILQCQPNPTAEESWAESAEDDLHIPLDPVRFSLYARLCMNDIIPSPWLNKRPWIFMLRSWPSKYDGDWATRTQRTYSTWRRLRSWDPNARLHIQSEKFGSE